MNKSYGANGSLNQSAKAEGPYGDILSLTAASGEYSDETVIRFKEDATLDFDNQLDAYKLMNTGLSPSFFSYFGNTNYSINSLPSSLVEKTIPLTLVAAFEGEYSFTADFSRFSGDQTIWLEDRLLGTLQNLREKNVYRVTLDQGSIEERFFLQYRNQDLETVTGTAQQSASNSIEISSYQQTVSVLCPSNTPHATIMVIDALGKKVYEQDNAEIASGKLEFTLPSSTGIHIVRLTTANTSTSKQIYLNR